MDLPIPYNIYPVALPHWIAWTLFLTVIAGTVIATVIRGRTWGWVRGVGAGVIWGLGLLVLSMVASMVIMFFVHDL